MPTDIVQSLHPKAPIISPHSLGSLRKQRVESLTLGLFQSNRRWRSQSEVLLALGCSRGEAEWALAQLVEAAKLEVTLVELGGIVKPFNKYRLRIA